MMNSNCDSMVVRLQNAPIDNSGNKALFGVSWVADRNSMIGTRNEDWVRRELEWFTKGSNKLEDMEAPVPKLFQACAGEDGSVNSAYGHILFNTKVAQPTLYQRVVHTLLEEGLGTRHAVAIITDRDIHNLAKANGRNDFICTNALNIMVDSERKVHIIAQMRSMDAVFGYRADYSMWDLLLELLVDDLNHTGVNVSRGDITFQVANLHVYPRHFDKLEEEAAHAHDRIDRQLRERAAKAFYQSMNK